MASQASDYANEARNIVAIEVLILGNISKRFRNLKQGIEKLAPTITRKASDILYDSVIEEIHAVNAIATEEYIKSVEALFDFTTDEYLVEVGSKAPQAYWIEVGRKASGKMPPVDRIYQWVLAKGVGNTYQDAFRIAKYLQFNDTPAKAPFGKAFEKALPKIQKYLGKAVDTEIKIQ